MQWERTARANLVRERERAEQQQLENQGHELQAQAVDDKHVLELLQHANELQASLPTDKPMTAWNLPVEKLRDVAKTMQELDTAAKKRGMLGLDMLPAQQQHEPQQQPAQNQKPETFEDGSTVQIKQNQDGTLEARLITGEVFRGDPLTVTRKLGEAQVNTKRWGQQQRAASQQPQAQADSTTMQGAVSYDTNGIPLVDFSKIPDVTRWQLDQMGQALGYRDGQEMVEDQIKVRQETQRLSAELAQEREAREDERVATSFQLQNPDFPGTSEAIEALGTIMDRNGLEYTSENLSIAHAYAVRNGIYQPLSPELVAVANNGGRSAASPRAAAPPQPPPSSAVDNRGDVKNEWQMPLDQLRKAALYGQASGQ